MTKPGVVLRLLLLGLCSLVLVPLQMLALRFGWSSVLHGVPVWFHRILLSLFNVRVVERGTPPGKAPTIVLANHVSWLDIPVIGSLHPLSFIAKSEIEAWPVVGLLARLQRSVFIDRQRRKATAEVNDALAHRLVNFIHRGFKIPSCRIDLTRPHPQPCLEFHIHRCLGPCVPGLTTDEAYADAVRNVKLFLEGKNRDLLVRYTAGLLGGVDDNRADPKAVIPILVEKYGSDAEINEEYATAANPEYIALMDSDFTDANGLLSVDPDKMENEILPGLEAAGATNLPSVDELLDVTIVKDAHALRS